MKKFYSLVAIAAFSVAAQAQTTFNYVLANQGFANAQELTTGNVIAGKITYEALANGASNTPKYYNTGTNLRLYSNNSDGNGNSYAIKAVGGVKFNQIKFKTDSYADYAPTTAIITVDGVVVPTQKDPMDESIYLVTTTTPASNITIKNGQTGTSAQIRIQEVEIVYSENLGVADFAEAAKAIQNTVWTNTASFSTKSNAKVEIFNVNGQLVKSFQVNGNKNVNVSDLAAGVYIVNSTENGKSTSTKVVKK